MIAMATGQPHEAGGGPGDVPLAAATLLGDMTCIHIMSLVPAATDSVARRPQRRLPRRRVSQDVLHAGGF